MSAPAPTRRRIRPRRPTAPAAETWFLSPLDRMYGIDPSAEPHLPQPLSATTAGLPQAPSRPSRVPLFLASLLAAIVVGAAVGWALSQADGGSTSAMLEQGNGDRAAVAAAELSVADADPAVSRRAIRVNVVATGSAEAAGPIEQELLGVGYRLVVTSMQPQRNGGPAQPEVRYVEGARPAAERVALDLGIDRVVPMRTQAGNGMRSDVVVVVPADG